MAETTIALAQSSRQSPPGARKLAYVQGRDASGEWGPVAPVWLKP